MFPKCFPCEVWVWKVWFVLDFDEFEKHVLLVYLKVEKSCLLIANFENSIAFHEQLYIEMLTFQSMLVFIKVFKGLNAEGHWDDI